MRKIFLLPVVLLILSCAGKDGRMTYEQFKKLDSLKENLKFDKDIPGDSFYVFYPACRISEDVIIEREQGTKNVFHYYYKSPDLALAADEEYYEQIQFEIPGNAAPGTYDLADCNAIFNWGCFCNFPDSAEARQNRGEVVLRKINDSTWSVKLSIENIPLQKKKTIGQNFIRYTPTYEVSSWDTLNRYDPFRRKQGHWITEDYFSILNGKYEDNYFTGTMVSFMYYREKKALRSVWMYENNKLISNMYFDEFGNRKK